MRLILEPATSLLGIEDCSACNDAYSATRHLDDRILNPTMAIRRQQLGKLEQHRTTKNDQADRPNMSGICQAKERAQNHKRGKTFKARRGEHSWSRLDRRYRCTCNEAKERPCSDDYEFAKHAKSYPTKSGPNSEGDRQAKRTAEVGHFSLSKWLEAGSSSNAPK
jgi:hypothetical protein